MAIDSIVYAGTDSLARPEKSFYPLKIPVSHWQLRHYISHPEPDVLYYASGQDIYYLNATTRKRKHITTLPFEARCTASGYGYVCVGGEEEGHFAVIKLEGRTNDVDAPLSYWQPQPSGPHAADVKVERIGEEIVNSISIHQIQDQDAHLYDVVAVLSNNDKTVRVYSLTQRMETTRLDFPFPMNHATISPDGRRLVAVGDMEMAFFAERVLQHDPPQIPKPHNRLTMCSVDWKIIGDVTLYTPSDTEHRGYFTTAWSPSGHYLALGSEAGYITVFDMRLLAQLGPDDYEEAILANIPSSRPDMHVHMCPGAVRSMLFAPEPWDLLIWAEDQGRICIGDLRTGLRTKQIIDLDPRSEGLTRLVPEDIPSEDNTQHARRLLDWADDFVLRDSNVLTSPPGQSFDTSDAQVRQRRHSRYGTRSASNVLTNDRRALESDSAALTAEEQEILEALRTTRQRAEARAQGGRPQSINYTTLGNYQAPLQPRQNPAASDRVRSTSELIRGNADYSTFPELLRTTQRTPIGTGMDGDQNGSLPPLHAIQEYLMLRDNPSTTQQPNDRGTARRRQSVIVSPPLSSAGQPNGLPPHAMRATLPSTSTPPPEDDSPWRTISDAMAVPHGALLDNAAEPVSGGTYRERDRESIRRLARDREQLVEIRRRFESSPGTFGTVGTDVAVLRSEFNALESRLLSNATNAIRGLRGSLNDVRARHSGRTAMGRSTISGHEIGVRTAGLAVSRDGRTIWAATEEGVFEISIALKARLCWPALNLR